MTVVQGLHAVATCDQPTLVTAPVVLGRNERRQGFTGWPWAGASCGSEATEDAGQVAPVARRPGTEYAPGSRLLIQSPQVHAFVTVQGSVPRLPAVGCWDQSQPTLWRGRSVSSGGSSIVSPTDSTRLSSSYTNVIEMSSIQFTQRVRRRLAEAY